MCGLNQEATMRPQLIDTKRLCIPEISDAPLSSLDRRQLAIGVGFAPVASCFGQCYMAAFL